MTAKAVNPEHSLRVGDILRSSWGYDQTNVNFYEVTAVTAKSVKLRPIESNVRETGVMCGRSTPCPGEYKSWDSFIDPAGTTKRVLRSTYNGETEEYIRLASFAFARKWDGEPAYTSWYA